MTELTPFTVARTLADIGKQVEDAQIRLGDALRAKTKAKHAYQNAFSQAILANKTDAEGNKLTDIIRRAIAQVSTSDLEAAYDEAADDVLTIRAEIDALHERLKIGQSLGAVMRTEWQGN